MFQLSGKAFLLSRISWNTFSFFILPKIKWWKLKYSNFWPKPWTSLAPCWEKCNFSTFSSSFFFCPERLCFQSRISPHTFSSLLLTPATQGSFSPLAFPFFYACHQAYVGNDGPSPRQQLCLLRSLKIMRSCIVFFAPSRGEEPRWPHSQWKRLLFSLLPILTRVLSWSW